MHKILAKFRKDGDREKHSSQGSSSDEEIREDEREQSDDNNSDTESLSADMDELKLDSKYSSLDMFEKRVILGI